MKVTATKADTDAGNGVWQSHPLSSQRAGPRGLSPKPQGPRRFPLYLALLTLGSMVFRMFPEAPEQGTSELFPYSEGLSAKIPPLLVEKSLSFGLKTPESFTLSKSGLSYLTNGSRKHSINISFHSPLPSASVGLH